MTPRWEIEERALLADCAVFRATRLMFLHAYFDESATGKSDPVMAMGGWVIDPKRLKPFNRDWRKVLRIYRVREAHAAPLATALEKRESKPSDFTGWDEKKASHYRYALSQVLDAHTRYGIFVAVVQADYMAEIVPYAENKALTDPYRWLMQICLDFLVIPAKYGPRTLIAARDHVKVVFDRGHRKPGVTEDYFLTLTTDQRYDIAKSGRIVGGYNAQSSADVPALQAADQLVWGTRRGAETMVKLWAGDVAGRRVRTHGLAGMTRVPIVGGYWHADNLAKHQKNILTNTLPIALACSYIGLPTHVRQRRCRMAQLSMVEDSNSKEHSKTEDQ